MYSGIMSLDYGNKGNKQVRTKQKQNHFFSSLHTKINIYVCLILNVNKHVMKVARRRLFFIF